MKHFLYSMILTVLTVFNSFGQRAQRYTISGFMNDSLSSESLISATVYNKANQSGTSANQFGFYSLTLPAGDVELVYSYVGYHTQTRSFHLSRDTVINVSLAGTMHLREIVISAGKTSNIHENTQMSVVNVPIAQIKSLPAFLGEVDVLKVLQLMPGVQSGTEGSSGLYVRGGGPDQNLFLLDGVPLYDVSHLFGFFSVFNADAINNVELIKGGFPARYGGRVSSVIDVSLKEGNMQKFHGDYSIGIVSSKLTLEGPIIKDKTSFIVSGRRTYIDAVARAINNFWNFVPQKERRNKEGYYFYDLTAKINHRFSEKDRIYLSAYMGDDVFYEKGKYEKTTTRWNRVEYEKSMRDNGLKWGNITTAFRWNHIFTNRLFANTTLTYSRFRYDNWNERESTQKITYNRPQIPQPDDEYYYSFLETHLISGIYDGSGKIAFDYIPSPDHYMRFGANVIHHTFTPETTTFHDVNEKREFGKAKLYAWEYAAYFEDDVILTSLLKANIGLHWSAFNIDGKFYNNIQPRISARYLINPLLSAKASYSRMAQYVHLLTNSYIGMSTDIWVPTTKQLRPQTSDQVAIGLAQSFRDEYEISLEGYFKTMNNVLEYKAGTSYSNLSDNWEQKIIQGRGRSYGVEFFAQKKTGSFTGWAGYTLSWTDRQFDELNNGKRFPYKYDRRHDFSLATMQRFGKEKKHEWAAVWVFGSGNSITVPIGVYPSENPFVDYSYYTQSNFEYSEKNSYRMKPYHRLDLSVTFVKAKKRGEQRWTLGLYNAYSRKNPFYIDLRSDYSDRWNPETETFESGIKYKFIQYSLFPIIPSISYNFKF